MLEIVLASVLIGPYRFLPERVERTSVSVNVTARGDCANGKCSVGTRKVFSGKIRSRLFRRFR